MGVGYDAYIGLIPVVGDSVGMRDAWVWEDYGRNPYIYSEWGLCVDSSTSANRHRCMVWHEQSIANL